MAKLARNLRGLRWIGLGFVALWINGCALGYLLRQGTVQISLLLRQEPIDSAIARLPPEKSEMLRLAKEIKQFAIRELGLRETHSYEKFVDLSDVALSHVVSASHRDRLEPYLWTFPIVGAVPYKGYFAEAEARQEQQRLDQDGFDTHVRPVAAFSLLGYMADPLYSSMLGYSKEGLANLIIHELTHATVFIPGNPNFNEGFATFIGNTGSIEFLTQKFGADAPAILAARDQKHDDQLFSDFINRTISTLREFYSRTDMTSAQKIADREAVFLEFKKSFATIPFRQRNYRGFLTAKLDNAYLLLFDTYQRDLGKFERIRTRFDSLKAMVAFFREEVAKQGDLEGFLSTW